jgi:hypothetical protein
MPRQQEKLGRESDWADFDVWGNSMIVRAESFQFSSKPAEGTGV